MEGSLEDPLDETDVEGVTTGEVVDVVYISAIFVH
jgi:hypothetical protein